MSDWHNSRLNLRSSTQSGDADYIRLYINPQLGPYELGRLTPTHIRKWIATLNQTLAPATTRKAHSILSSALQAAVNDRMIATNPCQGTKLPQTHEPVHRYLTMDEVHALANTINPKYKALVYTGALAGLRPGELAALNLDNLDLKNLRLTVTHTAIELNGTVTFGPPKTAAARRTISIGQTLTGILTAHLDEYGPGSNVTPLPTDRVSRVSRVSHVVFVSPEGGPLRLTNLRRRQWRQAVIGSVGAPMRIHDLRHTHAALSIAQGVHPRVLQERLGHRDITTTFGVYGGLFPGYDEDVAQALDDVFTASI
jgi:integrase